MKKPAETNPTESSFHTYLQRYKRIFIDAELYSSTPITFYRAWSSYTAGDFLRSKRTGRLMCMVGQYFRMAVMGFFVYGFSSYYLDQGSRSTVTDRSNAALEILACTVLVVFIIHGQAALRWSSKHFYDKQQRR